MVTSLGYIFILGIFLGSICKRVGLPALVGYICTGIILGPYALNLLDGVMLSASGAFRQIALVIILIRAGLSLKVGDLRAVGRPAFLMCFLPALFEILGMVIIAPRVFGFTAAEAVLCGAVVAAVSPAVVVPRMIGLIENGYGKKHSIPQLIMAGASVDDVFVIVVFSSFLSLAKGGQINVSNFLGIPVSIALGIVLGVASGIIFSLAVERFKPSQAITALLDLGICFIFLKIESAMESIVPISGLLAVMAMNVIILKKLPKMAEILSGKFNQLWIGAEILLFALVGAAVDLQYAASSGIMAVIVLGFVLVFRMAGVFTCLLGTKISIKERLFCIFAYMPKATVQAAIGSIPLSEGLACGNSILTVAVLAILITAPVGAFLIDSSYKRLLDK